MTLGLQWKRICKDMLQPCAAEYCTNILFFTIINRPITRYIYPISTLKLPKCAILRYKYLWLLHCKTCTIKRNLQRVKAYELLNLNFYSD